MSVVEWKAKTKAGTPLVKSVVRVFDILELFNNRQSPMQAIEIARTLDFPVTSTHAILKTMQALNYLDYDNRNRTFYPSLSLPMLLDYVDFKIEEEGRLKEFLNRINTKTKETISLSRRVDIETSIIFGLEAHFPIGVRVKEGMNWPILDTTTGACMIAPLDQDDLNTVIRRIAHKAGIDDTSREIKQLHERVAMVRRDGYLAEYNVQTDGIGVICMPILSPVSKSTLTIAIVGPARRIREREEEHIDTMVKLSKKYNITMLCSPDSKHVSAA